MSQKYFNMFFCLFMVLKLFQALITIKIVYLISKYIEFFYMLAIDKKWIKGLPLKSKQLRRGA